MAGFIYSDSYEKNTEFIYDRIRENIKLEKCSYILVPEQYSMEEEKNMLDTLGLSAQKYVQVITFKRLSNMVLSSHGPLRIKYIDSAGKNMLSTRALQLTEKKLAFFKKNASQKGFSSLLVSVFSEFKRYGITPDGLYNKISSLKKDTELYNKLSDLHILYKKYEELLYEKNSDAEDNLKLIIPKIEKCDFIRGCLYVSRFKSFTPVEHEALYALMKKTEPFFFFISDDLKSEKGIFRSASLTYKKLLSDFESLSLFGEVIKLEEDTSNGEIAHLKRNYNSYSPKEYPVPPSSIHIIRPRTIYDEVDLLAKHIVALIRTKGYTESDFLVLTSDASSYEDVIGAVFEKYEISAFLDKKEPFSSESLIRFLNSVLEIFSYSLSYERFMTALRSGFMPVSDKEADIFENYLLASGALSNNFLTLSPFGFNPDKNKFNLDEINKIKEKTIDPLLKLKGGLKGRKTAKDIIDLIKKCLLDFSAEETLKAEIDTLLKSGEHKEARNKTSVLNTLNAVLSQIESLFGDTLLTYKKFYEIFSSAICDIKIGSVPPLINQVVVSDVSKFSGTDKRIVMVLGIYDGAFPKSFSSNGLITDDERDLLKKEGLLLAPGADDKQWDELFMVYSVLTSPKDSLYLFFPIAGTDGKTFGESEVLKTIKRIFPKIKEEYKEDYDESFLLEGKNSAFSLLLDELFKNKGDKNTLSPLFKDVFDYFSKDSEFSEKLRFSETVIRNNDHKELLSKDKAKELYGLPLKLSVSRLETYNACAFSYFLTYGLYLDKRKKADLEASDMGSIIHEILYKYLKKKKEENADYQKITFRDIKKDIEDIVDNTEKYKESFLYESSSYYRYMLLKAKDIASATAYKIVSFYQKSCFRPYGFEIKIGSGGDMPPYIIRLGEGEAHIRGFIDRMDIYKKEDESYFNIVDYKSSDKNIDKDLLSGGVRIQPLIYAGIVKENIKSSFPSAMLYVSLDDPIPEFDSVPDQDEIKKGLLDGIKVDGVVLGDNEVLKSLDKDVFEKGTAKFFPTSKGKTISKSEMESLIEEAFTVAKESTKKIMDGNIDINPLYIKNKFDACQYCKFSSCCRKNEEI